MKIKKQHILITALFTVVNFIVLIILQFRLYVGLDKILRIIFEQTFLSDLKEFGIIVSSGIFTGAVLTFLISIVDYRSEKKIL